MSFRNSSSNSYPAIEVQVTRGNFPESVHLVDAVVMDSDGVVVAEFGQGAQRLTFPRSCIKMLQAVSFVESGAFHSGPWSEKHLALACASHNGEAIHTNLVMEWLNQLGFSEENLVCGPHFPYDEATSRQLIRADQQPRRRHNNCSGKHTSMLCTLKQLGISHSGYDKYDHPLQLRLRQTLSELSGESMDHSPWGVDGCGIPTYAMSLGGIARSLRYLVTGRGLSPNRQEAFRWIGQAVLHQPYLLGGSGDFCSDVMAAERGRLILKSGAEGVYSGVILDRGFSFCLKVRDGSSRAAKVAVGSVLLAFGGLTEDSFVRLSGHMEPPVKNWEGLTVGKIIVPHSLIS